MKKVIEKLVNVIVDKLVLWPFYYPIMFLMKEVKVDQKVKSNGVSVLALNAFRFRGDLKALARVGFKVYILPYKWQTRIFYAYNENDRNLKQEFRETPVADSSLYKDRIRVRRYLSSLLESLINKKNIDCVIGAGLFYNQDFDWGGASEDIGCPYIVFHRENLIGSKDRYSYITKRANFLKEFGFIGSAIIFHNNIMKSIFDEHSGVNPNRIFAHGSLRMDQYIQNIVDKNITENNQRITLFSFPPSNAISREYRSESFGWYKLHDEVHLSFLELAMENPDIEFVIKHKGVEWEGTRLLLEKSNAFKLENLKIYDLSFNTQELIFSSRVITGFCTTALLESAIADKPIIYPLFAEASKQEYRDFVCFKKASEMFDIANSKQDYKKLIMEQYENPTISESSKEVRMTEFENQVSSMQSEASKLYADSIIKICNEK
jgi:hypothetical protein